MQKPADPVSVKRVRPASDTNRQTQTPIPGHVSICRVVQTRDTQPAISSQPASQPTSEIVLCLLTSLYMRASISCTNVARNPELFHLCTFVPCNHCMVNLSS